MASNLFGQPSRNDIKVGYIDPKLGYVTNVSICKANEYAKKNPGTVFLFKDGNKVLRYLNINEVNDLTPSDLESDEDCEGVNQKKKCGPPTIQIYGGGGVGAVGNPVIGIDGAILAVDLIRSGNGYQYPPQVSANDNCNYGSGAVLTATIGEVSDGVETYTDEEDFEDYELCDPSDVGFGRRYGPNGEDLGPWEPTTYTRVSEDPIKKEIEKYEKIVRKLARSPFWTTRTRNPNKITASDPKITVNQVYNVTDKTNLDLRIKNGEKDPKSWNEFMNSYAISPVPPSNVKGSDYAGTLFTMEWNEEFPLTGEYVFRGLCDNTAQLYIDNQKVSDLGSFADPVKNITKTITEGIHNIRIDLLNIPLYENVSVEAGKSSSSSIKTQKVFNTVDYIDKANRTLWRTNVYGRGGFVNESGVCPFDTTIQLEDNPYAGTHRIIWDNVNFPVSGNYRIRLAVDDNVTLQIGDKVTIRKEGFIRGTNTSTGEFNESRFIEAGTYKIIADLEQISGGRFGFDESRSVNPMVLAVDIQVDVVEETVISPLSWNENPMGVSLTIDAPEPSIPQEPTLEQQGRCPNNPIWTTRFSPKSEKWYPVKFTSAWSKFMNRYAISPVKPLDTPGSDKAGVTYTTSWDIDIPYDGFYGLKGTVDNSGKILIDNNEVSKLDGFNVETPKLSKIFLTKGLHTITAEVFNEPLTRQNVVDQKIFRTKDWQVPQTLPKTVDVTFDINVSGEFANSFQINELGISVSKTFGVGQDIKSTVTKTLEYGRVYSVTLSTSPSGSIKMRTRGENVLQIEDSTDFNWSDMTCVASVGRFFSFNGNECKFVVPLSSFIESFLTKSGTSKDGVTYEGPPLFAYKDKRWGEFMNNHSVSPYLSPIGFDNPEINGIKKYTWKGVKFPESGQYKIAFQADNLATLYVGGTKVLTTTNYLGTPNIENVNITAGTYDIVVELENAPDQTNIFLNNPTGFAVIIRKNVTISTQDETPWSTNPIGISAILIPPPCPKKISGRGVVTDIQVQDPGNGYLPPSDQSTYPVSLRLKDVIVENPGINYNCGVDQIQITPSNGAVLDYVCDPFGKIREVKVLNPGLGFTQYPNITITTETGINASFRPQFEVVRDPIVSPEKLIQVTDLVGLKQNGYISGRPYYGAVFYKDGIRYAGFYETAGELVQVYDTLQESITAQVTTTPSAIQRQGTDTELSSNNPRLNLPGTPENLI